MGFHAKVVVALAYMASTSLAKPTGTRPGSANLLPRHASEECAAGEQWYVCSTPEFKGCSSEDPCGPFPTTTTTTTATSTSAPNSIITTSTPTKTALSCPSGTATSRVMQPTMYNLFPQDIERSDPPVNELDVQRNGNKSTQEQLVVFSDLPKEARNCQLGWVQGAPEERTFVADGNSLVQVLPLAGMPKGGEVSYEKLSSFLDSAEQNTEATHASFDDFDGPEYPARNNTVGSVPCAKDILLGLSIDGVNGDGAVFMKQDALNGLAISFQC